MTARSEPPPYENAPPGHCRWCGGEIVFPSHHKRAGEVNIYRTWHSAESGDPRDCIGEHKLLNWPSFRRRAVLVRDEYRCVDCLAEGREVDRDVRKDVDHIVALADGGTNHMSNLTTRCRWHHRQKTAQEAKERAERKQFPDERDGVARTPPSPH